MKNAARRQNRITLVFLAVFAIGVILWSRDYSYRVGSITNGTVQTIIYIGLVLGWNYCVQARLLQKGIRKYLSLVCWMLVLWILLRGLKYYIFPPGTTITRYLWYFYYLPMMLYPMYSVFASVHIGRRDSWSLPRRVRFLLIVPLCIFLIILTNDLHQLVFVFPEDGHVWSDMRYRYGTLYSLPFLWFLGCTITTLVILIRHCRIPRRGTGAVFLTVLPSILGLCYNFLYIRGHVGIFSDLIVTMGFLTIATFEIAIRTGFIRSNSNYVEVFQKSSISAQLVNQNLEPVYVSSAFSPYSAEALKRAVDTGRIREHYLRLSAYPIQGGYVVWQEDVQQLVRLQEELEDANEQLKGRSLALNQKYQTAMKRRRLEEQNRLYNEMQKETAGTLGKLAGLIGQFEAAPKEEEQNYLCKVCLIFAYLKRRNNLILLAEGNKQFSFGELRNCFQETAKALEMFGVVCKIHLQTKSKLSVGQMIVLYDTLEEIIWQTVEGKPSYYVSVSEENSRQVLRIRIAGIPELPWISVANLTVEQEDEEEFLLQMSVGKEEIPCDMEKS